MRKLLWISIILLILDIVLSVLVNFATGFLQTTLEPYATAIYILLGLSVVVVIVLSIVVWRGEEPVQGNEPRLRQRTRRGGRIETTEATVAKESGATVDQTATGERGLIQNTTIEADGKTSVTQEARGGQITDTTFKVK